MADPLRRLTPVVRLAPAKVNLTLAITGRRPDGFHELHSVMVPLELSDRLSAAISGGPADTLHVRGADAGPVADNLVLRAIAATRAAVGRGWPGAAAGGAGLAPALAVRLEKAIPVAAGLAGGSTDAAAAIDAALEAWDADLDEDRRRAVAASLGSDVPFFLVGAPAVVEGRGERVTALPGLRGEPAGVLLVTPALSVSTADVFAAYAAGARPSDPGSTRNTSHHLAQEWRSGLDADRLFQRAGVLAPANDLLAATAVVAPDVVATRRALVRLLPALSGNRAPGPRVGSSILRWPTPRQRPIASTRRWRAVRSGWPATDRRSCTRRRSAAAWRYRLQVGPPRTRPSRPAGSSGSTAALPMNEGGASHDT